MALAQAEWRDGGTAAVSCGICGQKFMLPAERDRGSGDADYRERVRAFALEHGLDPATATSVMEEIIPLDRARAMRKPAASAPEPAAARTKTKLTPWILAGVAVMAVVMFAVTRREPANANNDIAAASAEPPVTVVAAEPAVPPPAPLPVQAEAPVVSWRDDAGNLTEIAGPDPASVLGGLCREFDGLDPVTVKDSLPPNPGERIGVVRRASPDPGMLTVAIRRDPRTGRWYIGDRRGAIRFSQADSGAAPKATKALSTSAGG